MNIIWSKRAKKDIREYLVYISLDNPDVIVKFSEYLNATLEQLANFPLIGRTGEKPGTREFILPKYPRILIVYKVEKEQLYIVTIHHTSKEKKI